eukprot:CAMPEP_0174924816 /NCGR_PEP_ID=MMETSP1355-20121228/7501_1 /TAXON_ID=464990 /ORGANISM="Hemiselmis tepida, Strain CCMP443" /LENGTH=127 /DNA_ID=CAMNT_0016170659 /DNA_START=325 /DNA_END=705 /DNA_ORIENTATION=-
MPLRPAAHGPELDVRVIADGGCLCALAGAELHRSGLGRGVLHGLEVSPVVRSVAKGLVLAPSAGAPVVVLPCLALAELGHLATAHHLRRACEREGIEVTPGTTAPSGMASPWLRGCVAPPQGLQARG